ncbi:hypothetical protein M9H77_31090 [Catharanthus roseus]|uniref:Uncharacterized protein n=1 Tax=Catharanthus roseus TaxID=4058 RepID=A0ACC0A3C9_CATRO|nr:hypothetical protein M9H77_31090 [Catharanthus roseus]
MASGLAWLSLYAQANALPSICSSIRQRPTSENKYKFFGEGVEQKESLFRKKRKRSPFSNGSEEVMVEVLLRSVQPSNKELTPEIKVVNERARASMKQEAGTYTTSIHLQMPMTPRVRTGKYGANVFYRVFSFLVLFTYGESFPLIKLQVTLGFDFVAPLSLLVPPKPSGNAHTAAFYVYEDKARDERMKIAAFIDAGEDKYQSRFIKGS